MLLQLLATALILVPAREGRIGECDPVGGPRLRWTAETKAETRARVQAVCKHLRASPLICEYLDVVVCRESFCGAAGVRHTRALGENGLGAMGLSVWWMRHLWPGTDEDPAFCQPEVTALVAIELVQRAVVRWNATNLVGVQAVYAGRFHTWVDDEGVTHRAPGRGGETLINPGLCARVNRRRLPSTKLASCMAPITAADVGRRVPARHRRELALELAARFDARKKK